ncbi:MAG: hypothetical protein QMC36_07790 [Patescibacteria group bacterium]
MVSNGFFSRIFCSKDSAPPSVKPQVPCGEVSVGQDPFLTLNRLLSDPHA